MKLSIYKMAKTERKDSVTFFIGGDGEENDSSRKIVINDITVLPNPPSRALTDSPICSNNDTDRTTCASKAEVNKRRLKSGTSMPTNYNPLKTSKEEEMQEDLNTVMEVKSTNKSAEIASIPRRYVLNASSKVPLKVRRNHSGIKYFGKVVMLST